MTAVGPTAQQILRRSDVAMDNPFPILRLDSSIPPAASEPVETYSIVVQGRRCTESSRGDAECSCLGGSEVWGYSDRARGGVIEPPWSEDYLPGGTPPRRLEIAGEDVIGDRATWVITYEFLVAGIEGPTLVQRREWIAKADYRLVRQEAVHSDPRGISAEPPEEAYTIRSDLIGPLGFEFPCPMGSE
jgi:hypothetical protein